MSTSAIDRAQRTAFVYLVVSILTAIGGGVYEFFSHGVWSGFMVYAFLFPLLLGALPFSILSLTGNTMPAAWALNFWHAGTATLTVGSLFEGALEIFGTTNHLTLLYWVVGAVMLICALLLHLIRSHQ